MALSLGQTGTADSVDAEYFNWESSDRRFMVHMHLDAIDGLARDVIENSEGLPVEVGGILLGQVGRGERPVVWIERYQRVQIDHRSGPNFVLDREDHAVFEQAARSLSEDGELTVVGYYRTHLRPGLQLEEPDHEVIGRYFRDSEDLILLLKPENTIDILAEFFGRPSAAGTEAQSELQPLGPAFPFRGRLVGLIEGKPEEDDFDERTGKTVPAPPSPEPRIAAGAHRRLVPDFQPAPENQKPAREFFMEARPSPAAPSEEPELSGPRQFLKKRWPLLAAILLVGAAAAVLVQQAARHDTAPNAAAPVRPLGLYADASGQNVRFSWNISATALQGARDVKLFVRDDGEQNRVDLTPQDRQSGTYRYPAKGHDVTFRMEVTDSAGHLSAESFRLMAPEPSATAAAPPARPAVAEKPGKLTPPTVIHRVQAVVPSSLRPRINGSIPLDVRVRVDVRGRVTSAEPVSRPHPGVESFLATRAVYAAKQWRFKPARQDGKAVPGTEIIHFVFSR